MEKPGQPKKRLLPLLLVNFIGTMGYSLIIPFLVFLVIRFGGNELIYGVMGATYSIFQFIGAPILGRWSDQFGRRKILLLSQAGTFLAWVLFLVALLVPVRALLKVSTATTGSFVLTLPLVVLFLARALDGLTGGNISVANAYMADISTDDNRKSNFGKMAASSNLGFIVGPALAGVLGATIWGEIVPVLAAMAVSFLAMCVIHLYLPESVPCVLTRAADEKATRKIFGQEHQECHRIAGAEQFSFRDVWQLPSVPVMIVLYFLIFLAFNFFYVAFPVHAQMSMQWSVFELGVFFAILSLIMVIVQGPVMDRISKKYSEGTLIMTGNVILCLNFLLITTGREYLIFMAAVCYAAGNGIMWPSFLSLLAKIAGPEYQGAVQGYANSAGSLASIIGLILGGVIYGWIGISTFFIPAVLILVIVLISTRLYRQPLVSPGPQKEVL